MNLLLYLLHRTSAIGKVANFLTPAHLQKSPWQNLTLSDPYCYVYIYWNIMISVQSPRGNAVLLFSQNVNLHPTFKLTYQLQLPLGFKLYVTIFQRYYRCITLQSVQRVAQVSSSGNSLSGIADARSRARDARCLPGLTRWAAAPYESQKFATDLQTDIIWINWPHIGDLSGYILA